MPVEDRINREESLSTLCGSCVHYYVTWDKGFPYGCRAMGFKCRNSPSLRVRQASGMDCQLYDRKKRKEG